MHKQQPDLFIQELRFEAVGDLDKFMRLEELEDRFSNKRVGFVVKKSEV